MKILLYITKGAGPRKMNVRAFVYAHLYLVYACDGCKENIRNSSSVLGWMGSFEFMNFL